MSRLVRLLLLFVMPQTGTAQKQMCLTIDDLPVVSQVAKTPAARMALTKGLLTALRQHNVPAVGFVIGEKLHNQAKHDPEQVALAKEWLKAGFTLDNHTYAHKDYNQVGAANYQRDVSEGAAALAPLLRQYGQSLRYFRHPYLHRGNTPSKRDSLVQFLRQHHYREAPVSIDNADYLFSAAYDTALLRCDSTLAASVGRQYVAYMLACTHYYEAQADSLFRRPIRHILLTHANTINSVYLTELLTCLRAEGYQFITLDEALKDPAYKTTDTYVGNAGISWLHRWALTQGKKGAFFRGEPDVPAAIIQLAENR